MMCYGLLSTDNRQQSIILTVLYFWSNISTMDYTNNPNYTTTHKLERVYKQKLICYTCRKVFKRRTAEDIGINDGEDGGKLTCPNCGRDAHYIGPKFRAPKSDNTKAWHSIEVLTSLGVLYFFGWAGNNTPIPESKKGLEDLLKDMKEQYECSIRRWLSNEYSEDNKVQIKYLSERVAQIDRYLNK